MGNLYPHAGTRDIIATGTNHRGLSALQDGDNVEMEINGLGRLHQGARRLEAHLAARHTTRTRQYGVSATAPQSSGKYASQS